MIKGSDGIHNALEKIAGLRRAAVGATSGAVLGGIAGAGDKRGVLEGVGRGALAGAVVGGSAGALSKLPRRSKVLRSKSNLSKAKSNFEAATKARKDAYKRYDYIDGQINQKKHKVNEAWAKEEGKFRKQLWGKYKQRAERQRDRARRALHKEELQWRNTGLSAGKWDGLTDRDRKRWQKIYNKRETQLHRLNFGARVDEVLGTGKPRYWIERDGKKLQIGNLPLPRVGQINRKARDLARDSLKQTDIPRIEKELKVDRSKHRKLKAEYEEAKSVADKAKSTWNKAERAVKVQKVKQMNLADAITAGGAVAAPIVSYKRSKR